MSPINSEALKDVPVKDDEDSLTEDEEEKVPHEKSLPKSQPPRRRISIRAKEPMSTYIRAEEPHPPIDPLDASLPVL